MNHSDHSLASYPDHAAALTAALRDDPFYRALARSVEGLPVGAALARYFDLSMVEADRFGLLHLPATGAHGASVWSLPLDEQRAAERRAFKRDQIASRLGAAALAFHDAVAPFMSAQAAKAVDAAGWYLSIVGVDPACQGRGLGAPLVAEVAARADAIGVPTWLETFTPRNMTFYRRLGYEVALTVHEPTIGADYAVMVRDPGDAAAVQGGADE